MPTPPPSMSAVGLFAGIGGVELGLQRSGVSTSTLVENWEPARAVLASRFPEAALRGDVADVKRLPRSDVLTAGFPCTDLSQAGRMAGITGEASGLVSHVFRLMHVVKPTWVVLENVRNMLVLDRGRAMEYLVSELANRGYRWAYRLVDSRAVGVPQRRQRVILVASLTEDPRAVLFADDAGEPDDNYFRDDAFGFYWTEGLTGLGWARDAIPTLKGGSTLGIPSPPAVWIPGASPGRKLVTPLIEDAEAFQGFPRGWTEAASSVDRRGTSRWKLTGNAVTVGISQWLGKRLVAPGRNLRGSDRRLDGHRSWPTAAWGDRSGAWARSVSMWPVQKPYAHLLDTLSHHESRPLSLRAASGFLGRTERSRLHFDADFLIDLKEHVEVMKG